MSFEEFDQFSIEIKMKLIEWAGDDLSVLKATPVDSLLLDLVADAPE